MNITEALKAAGWTDTAISMASEQEMQRMERFAQIIRNQALEDAAKCSDELPAPESCSQVERSLWAVATMAAGDAVLDMKKDQQ